MSDATESLVASLRESSEGLRDAWLFDESGYESLYLREDVRERIEDVRVERYIDNERYGYVTRETYESLHYTEYTYTVRGFADFVQYRTFLTTADRDRVGVMASFDTDAEPDYRALTDRLTDAAASLSVTVGGSASDE